MSFQMNRNRAGKREEMGGAGSREMREHSLQMNWKGGWPRLPERKRGRRTIPAAPVFPAPGSDKLCSSLPGEAEIIAESVSMGVQSL